MALPDVRRVPSPSLLAPRHRRGGVRRAVPASTPARTPGGSSASAASPTTRRSGASPRAHSWRKYLFFSPDDRFLLGLGDGYTLRVWRVADGQPALRDELRGCRAHAFSPDGRRLAVGQQEWVLCFDLATGQEVKRWRLPAQAISLAFHPDERQTGRRVLRFQRRFRVRRGERGPPHGPARGGDERPGRRLASGRGAPGRCGFRPAHSDLERGREAPGGDPGGPRAECHGR